MTRIETTEGSMEVNDDRTELYKHQGDLCCPMIPTPNGSRNWWATCPMSGIMYLVTEGEVNWAISRGGRVIGVKRK